METPRKSGAQWSKGEVDLLEKLLKGRLDMEQDRNIQPLDRNETFQWLSDKLQTEGGFNRSTKAIERRLQGKLSFPRSLKFETKEAQNPPRSFGETSALGFTAYDLSSRPSRASTSSSDDIPLSQLRQNLGSVSTIKTESLRSPNAGEKKRKRHQQESETLDTIIVEPHTVQQGFQESNMNSSLQNPATISSPCHNTPPTTASPFTPRQAVAIDIDDNQFKKYAQKKAEVLKIKNFELQREKESRLVAKNQHGSDLRRLRQELQNQQAEAKELTRLTKELHSKRTATEHQYTQVASSSRTDEAAIKEIDEKIAKNEEGIKAFSAAALF